MSDGKGSEAEYRVVSSITYIREVVQGFQHGFFLGLQRTKRKHDSIFVMVD